MSRKPLKYDQVYDGHPYYPSTRVHYEQCCDCGLTHTVHYRIVNKKGQRIPGAKLRITAWRHKHFTKNNRRKLRRSGSLR